MKILRHFTLPAIYIFIFLITFLAVTASSREKFYLEREKMMQKKAKLPDDFLVRCEVGEVGVLLHYDTGIGYADVHGPMFEYPVGSDNGYMTVGNFWYRYKDEEGDICPIPAGNLQFIADCAGVTGIYSASAADIDAPDWAISALDTRSDWFDRFDNTRNQNGSNVFATVITHAWSEDYRGDFIFWDITFENKGNIIIEDLYFGKRMDCDISTNGGGSGARGFWRDDMTAFYKGKDDYLSEEYNDIYISYMFDADNPNIQGDDTGGWKTHKESKAFIGTITVSSPPTKDSYFKENQPSAHVWWDWNSDPSSSQEIYNYLSWGHNNPEDPYRHMTPSPHDYRYLSVWGPYDIPPNESITIRLATGCGYAPQEYFDDPDHPLDIGIQGLKKNLVWAKKLYQTDWVGPSAPPAPSLNYFVSRNQITIIWDDASETALDPITAIADFEGYRLWKSIDNVNWELLLQVDLVNDIGRNTGLVHEYVDNSVQNGYTYFYALTAYDRGDKELGVESLESSKTENRIQVSAIQGYHQDGVFIEIFVVPNPYYASAPWNYSPSRYSPSEDRIGFFGLPEWADIYIYNLSGDHVDKIEHRDPTSGVAYWDGLSKKMYSVVSGVYIYVVEDRSGNKVRGKFVFVR
ncbi:hypothetical protein ACFL4T_11345 [candidate division KSB1 bacterium]